MAAYLSPLHKHNGHVGFRGQFGERSLEAPPVLCGTKAERSRSVFPPRAAAGSARRGRGFRVPNCTPPPPPRDRPSVPGPALTLTEAGQGSGPGREDRGRPRGQPQTPGRPQERASLAKIDVTRPQWVPNSETPQKEA